MVRSNVVVSPDARLVLCDEQPTSLSFVAPINERLDQLVELADQAGARTTRKELVAALILGASDSAVTLRDAVLTYRTSRAKDAAVSGDPARVLELRQHRPGPRRKRAIGA